MLVDRGGAVTHVMVGDARSIELPDWGRVRAGRGRLRGLRCIHTHLGDEPLTRDDLTDLALLRLDAMVAVSTTAEGLPGLAHAAALRPANADGAAVEHLEPLPPAQLDLDFRAFIRDREEELARQSRTREVGAAERAILVSVTAGRRPYDIEMQLDELKELARSASVEVVGVVTQHRPRVDPKLMIGSGRLEELVIRAFQSDVDLVIFDQNLTPTQARNLAERLDLRVIDRTQLILDIFAQNAKTAGRQAPGRARPASLPAAAAGAGARTGPCRASPAGSAGAGPASRSSRSTGGACASGSRGWSASWRRCASSAKSRRRRRTRRQLPILSIVGYTNAGKSTLLRSLTESSVLVADRMFATLDPTSRRLRFPREREVVVTDTVGFIRDLPPDLVAAFRATLEEIADASLLLHVVDAAAPDHERRIAAVREVLESIQLGDTPELLVFNRIDLLAPGAGRGDRAAARRRRGLGADGRRPARAAGARRRDAVGKRATDDTSHEPLALAAQGG